MTVYPVPSHNPQVVQSKSRLVGPLSEPAIITPDDLGLIKFGSSWLRKPIKFGAGWPEINLKIYRAGAWVPTSGAGAPALTLQGYVGTSTIGGSSATTSTYNPQANIGTNHIWTAASGDVLKTVELYGSGTGIVEIAMYEYVDGIPVTQILGPTKVNVGSSLAWYSTAVDVALTAGHTYCLAIDYWTDEAADCVFYFGSSTTDFMDSHTQTSTDELPATWTEDSISADQVTFRGEVHGYGTTPTESFTGYLGYTTVAGTQSGTPSDSSWGTQALIDPSYRWTAGANQFIKKLEYYSQTSGSWSRVGMGVYTVVGGVPVTRVGGTRHITIGSTAKWWNVPVNIPLTNGVTYCIAVEYWGTGPSMINGSYVWFDSGAGSNLMSNHSSTDMPATWSHSSYSNDRVSARGEVWTS